MREITLEELLEAGCHFGHQVTRQNPKARDYVFESRDNIHIIDLAKTKEELELAAKFVKELAAKGGTILFLGTKRQARSIVTDATAKIKEQGADGVFTVTNRWVGGILTNFSEVAKNIKRMKDLEKRLSDEDEKAKYTKKEISLWEKEKQKLTTFYGGIADMAKLPDALFIIDTHLESLAVREAKRMNVATVGIVDTNADPTVIDYPIPANDDAVGSIELLVKYIADAWVEGKLSKSEEIKEKKESSTDTQKIEEKPKAKTKEKSKEKKSVKGKSASGKKKTEEAAVA